MKRVPLHPLGWADQLLMARLSYQRFAAVVERARREVVREAPEYADMPVRAMSAEAGSVVPWGEFYLPNGPVVIWQFPYEVMPDQENYYRQVKAVIRHEFRHAAGETHPQPGLAHVGTSIVRPLAASDLTVTVRA